MTFFSWSLFNWHSTPTTTTTTPPITYSVFYVDSSGNVGTLNPTTGQSSVFGNPGIVFFDVAQNSSGQLFGVTSSGAIYSINSQTGASSLFLNLGTFVNSLAADSNNNLYAVNGSGQLLRISPTGGVSTLGSIGASEGDLLVIGNNVYLARQDNVLVKYDLTTNQVSNVANLPEGIFGLAQNPNGNIYAVGSNGKVYDVNPATGSVVFTGADVNIPANINGTASTPLVPANGAPSFTNLSDGQTISIPENTTFVVDANATDPNNDTLTFSIAGGADASRFTINPTTGVLSFINAPDFEGARSAIGNDQIYDVTVRVSDGKGGFQDRAIFVNVTDVNETPVNRAPVAVDDPGRVTALGSPITVNVLANDSDPDGNPLTITNVSLVDPADGTVAIVNNQVVYTPSASAVNGTSEIRYTISDGQGGTSTATAFVFVNPAPVDPNNLIQNGSYENTSGMATTGFGFSASNGIAPNWTTTNGADVEFHNDRRGGLNPVDGNNWLDLEESPGNVRVGQNVQGVVNGQTYQLTFSAGDIANSDDGTANDNTVTVYWGGQVIATINPTDGSFTQYQFNLVGGAGNGNNRLEFEGGGRVDGIGASIDKVSLVAIANPVPGAPTTQPDMTAATDTGVSNTDNNTRDNTPDFTVTVPAGTTPNLYVNGVKVPSTFVNGVLTPVNPLPEGSSNIQYSLTSPLGQESGLSPALPVTIDTVAPAAPSGAPDMTAATDTGPSNTDNNTDDSTPDFAVTVPAGTTPNLFVDGVKVPATFANGVLTPNSPIANGPHTIAYSLTDAAGNESAPSPALPIVIGAQSVAPTTPSTAPDMTAATDTGVSNTDNLTRDNTPDFAVTVPAGMTPNLYVNGVKVPSIFANGVLTPVNPLPEGPSNVQFSLTNPQGQESGLSPALPVNIDTVAPAKAAPAPDMTAATDTGPSNTDNNTDDSTPDFVVTVPAGTTATLLVDGAKVPATFNPTTGTLTPTNPISPGAHTISYVLTDAAGNESLPSDSLAILIGQQVTPPPPPPPTGAIALAPASDTGVVGDNITSDRSPKFIVDNPNDLPVKLFANGVEIGGTTYDPLTNTVSLPSGVQAPNGTYQITYALVNNGVTGPQSAPLSLQITDGSNANIAPDARDDVIGNVNPNNGVILFSPASLLSNDFDSNGDAIRGVGLGDAQNGQVSFDGTNVVFIPNPGFTGLASFTYTITDDKGGFDKATVSFNVTAAGGNVINGTPANDNPLNGTSGNDIINGLAGNDTIDGGNGNDIISGGRGNDTMTGGAGSDVFKWVLDDIEPFGNGEEVDTIFADANDKLDLKDLLINESATAASLDNYLHFNFAGGDTIIKVSVAGSFGDGNVSGANLPNSSDQTIVLKGFDLTAGNTLTDQQIIQNLLNANALITD